VKVEATTYRFQTCAPEADGTLEWGETTVVAVDAHAADRSGLGWTYSTRAAAALVHDHLAPILEPLEPMDIPRAWQAMHRACRNLGTRGLVAQAISAVDIALWDLKARLLDVSLTALLGPSRDAVPVYGSGGFTTFDHDRLGAEVDHWASAGCTAMKIKIGESWGTAVERDLARVRTLRQLAGDGVELMVDANGGYGRGLARRVGAQLDELGVAWFEEPVSSDDIDGMRAVRDAVRCDVAAGEYAADVYEAARLCPAVDCLQLDATRCGGYTGFLRAAAVAASHNLDVSAHCAPALHLPVAAATPNLRHVEWFADHARLEPLLADGVPEVHGGTLRPTGSVGHGMSLSDDVRRWIVN
jgi:L-alanine-DL-glutamate epimerase-like enolase superfamily enzyme